jgi:hypothetical protein
MLGLAILLSPDVSRRPSEATLGERYSRGASDSAAGYFRETGFGGYSAVRYGNKESKGNGEGLQHKRRGEGLYLWFTPSGKLWCWGYRFSEQRKAHVLREISNGRHLTKVERRPATSIGDLQPQDCLIISLVGRRRGSLLPDASIEGFFIFWNSNSAAFRPRSSTVC